jgi:hypothetical protein
VLPDASNNLTLRCILLQKVYNTQEIKISNLHIKIKIGLQIGDMIV